MSSLTYSPNPEYRGLLRMSSLTHPRVQWVIVHAITHQPQSIWVYCVCHSPTLNTGGYSTCHHPSTPEYTRLLYIPSLTSPRVQGFIVHVITHSSSSTGGYRTCITHPPLSAGVIVHVITKSNPEYKGAIVQIITHQPPNTGVILQVITLNKSDTRRLASPGDAGVHQLAIYLTHTSLICILNSSHDLLLDFCSELCDMKRRSVGG